MLAEFGSSMTTRAMPMPMPAPIPVKTAMNMLGWEAGPLRAPLCEMEDAHKEMLRQEMIRYGLLK